MGGNSLGVHVILPGKRGTSWAKGETYSWVIKVINGICCISGSGAGEISCINPMPIVIPSNHEYHIIRFIARGIGYGNIYIGW